LNDKARAMVLASFVADSLALGVHWIYSTDKIDATVGRVETLLKPAADSYHPTKDRGDFTHYGDQALVLLQSLAQRGMFDLDHFARSWRDFFGDYTGYVDRATEETLKNFSRNDDPRTSGSSSTELGGAARIAPLVYMHRTDRQTLAAAARAQTAMTHADGGVLDAAEFLAETAAAILDGNAPSDAIRGCMTGRSGQKKIEAGLASADRSTRDTILSFGQMCEIEGSLPSVIHLVVKYEKSLKEALIENVMAGGDSAGRGMVVGMLLGAHLGTDAIPADWLADMNRRRQIDQLLQDIDRR
jgi:ADP-ribosylglycohydrolase